VKPTSDEATGIDLITSTLPAPSTDMLYRGLFNKVPVSLWEEDASEVKSYLEELQRSGAGDIRTYLDYHPEEVAKCAGMVKVLAVNEATTRLYEARDANELLSNFDKLLCEESYEVLKQVLLAIAEGRTHFTSDTFNRTMTGVKKHLLMSLSVAPGCETTYERVWVSMVDLTEHEQFAKELDDTDKRYRMFTEYVNDIIWTMDMGLNFTFVSPSVERTLGYTVEEILGMQYQDLLSTSSMEVAMAAVVEELSPDAMRNRDPRRSRVLELEFKTKNGSTLWGELNISFMLDKDNVPTGVVGVIRDVTDRHTADEAIERSWQAQKVINDLLQISLDDISRDEMLQQMLERIVDVPWFAPDARGGILLADQASDSLVMKAESGLATEFLQACARRRVGECFCGAAASSGQIMYRSGSGSEERRCQPTRACGQYCVPFSSSGSLLGVLNLYLSDGHTCSEKEMEFLSGIGRVLASSIERKRATQTLRKSEAAYRAIFDKASDSIFIHDPETGRILDVNNKTCETFGYTHEEMLKLSVGDISADDSRFTQQDAVKLIQSAATKGPRVFEWKCKDKSGRQFWVEVSLSFAELSSGDRILAFVRDIDARKRAERKARALSGFLEGIMDTVDIWISAADSEGKILVWNEAAERISGYARDEVLGNSSIWELIYPDDEMRRTYMEERCRVLHSGVFCDRHRTSIVSKGGEPRLICWNAYKLTEDNGDICGAIALAFDVTDAADDAEGPTELYEFVIRALQAKKEA
jgi:PAS domain S-box-containing protein